MPLSTALDQELALREALEVSQEGVRSSGETLESWGQSLSSQGAVSTSGKTLNLWVYGLQGQGCPEPVWSDSKLPFQEQVSVVLQTVKGAAERVKPQVGREGTAALQSSPSRTERGGASTGILPLPLGPVKPRVCLLKEQRHKTILSPLHAQPPAPRSAQVKMRLCLSNLLTLA